MARDQVSKMIGAAIKRKEDPRFITGEGKYTADVQLMGMACMMVLRSPHAHARITRIDASRALQRPDVLKVLTGPEVIQHCKTQFLTIGEAGGTKPKSSWPMAAELAQIHRRDDYAAAERAIGAREGDGPGTIWGRGGPASVFSCRGETL